MEAKSTAHKAVMSAMVNASPATYRDWPRSLFNLGGRLVPVEVKSGETVPADAVQNLEWWTGLPDNPTTGGLLVHGGKTRFQIKGFDVLPWFLG